MTRVKLESDEEAEDQRDKGSEERFNGSRFKGKRILRDEGSETITRYNCLGQAEVHACLVYGLYSTEIIVYK